MCKYTKVILYHVIREPGTAESWDIGTFCIRGPSATTRFSFILCRVCAMLLANRYFSIDVS